MTDWQNLREAYAREMYELVAALQDDPALKDADVTVDYVYVTITLPDSDGSIIIHNKKTGRFVVELYRGEWGEYYVDGELNVSIEVLGRLVRHYLNRMADMQPFPA